MTVRRTRLPLHRPCKAAVSRPDWSYWKDCRRRFILAKHTLLSGCPSGCEKTRRLPTGCSRKSGWSAKGLPGRGCGRVCGGVDAECDRGCGGNDAAGARGTFGGAWSGGESAGARTLSHAAGMIIARPRSSWHRPKETTVDSGDGMASTRSGRRKIQPQCRRHGGQ